MSLITRQYGPNAKGSKLTNLDMDNNLYYLQSIGVSGLTFSSSTLTLTNPTGGTKTVTINDYYTTGATYSDGLIYFDRNDQLSAYTVNIGSLTGDANTFITAVTYTSSANTITLTDNTNNSLNAYIDSVSGLTVNGSLNVNTISAITYQNLPQDIFVTGGTYTNGEILFKNNTGGYFTVSGLPIGGAGGQVYYLNLSQNQPPYQEFSPIGSNNSEQTTGITVNSGVTSTISSFLSPTGYPNTLTIPAGYWSFYLHGYKDSTLTNFDIFCEVYVVTTGGTETLILTTEGANVTSINPTPSMFLSDGYYSGGSIDVSDRILINVVTTNTGTQIGTMTFLTEGQQHYSYGVTPFSNFNALTCETLSGCTTIVDLENNKVNKGGDTMTGTLNVPTISATTLYGDGSNLTGISTQDTFVTGGTFSSSTITFTNNTGGTFNVTGLTIGTTLSKTLFVDPSGNDSTAVKGDINKPYANLYAAKSASTSGDTIYVFPGTWTYDNRNSAGNPYNGQIDTLVNLWKDGVAYYFSPNTNVVFLNQTVTGQAMYLFKSPGSGGTCTVRGALQFSGDSIGVDSSNGAVYFFDAGIGDGYVFDCEAKSLASKSQVLSSGINTITGQTAVVKITADEISYTHLGNNVGQSGGGAAILCRSTADIQYFLNFRKLKSTYYRAIQFRGLTTGSTAVLNIDYVESFGGNAAIACELNFSPNIYLNINRCNYVGYPYISNLNSSTFKFLANVNWYEVGDSGVVQKFLSFSSSAGVSVFNGSYTFNFNRILFDNQTNEKMFINGDVIINTSSFTNAVFLNRSVGEINFNGRVSGNMQGVVGIIRNGRLNITNSNISPSITGGTFVYNDTTSTGATVVTNSTVVFNTTSSLINGQYLNNYILNSQIKNAGTGNIFVNSTSTGTLQLHNSTLVSTSGSTINISGTAPLITSNSTSNTSISAPTINGSITVLTELNLI